MACYSIQLNRVDLGAVNPEVLEHALKALKIVRNGTRLKTAHGIAYLNGDAIESSAMSTDQLVSLRNEIKRAASRRVLEIASKRRGLKLTPVRGRANVYTIGGR